MKSKRLQCCLFMLVMLLILSVFPVFAEELSGNQYPEYLEEAAADLREGMKEHQEIIEISFRVDLDSFDGTDDSAWELGYQVQELGLAHTGVPNEGDFLRFSLWYFGLTDVAYTRQADGWQFTLNYYAVYYTTAEQEAELDTEIEALVQQLELKSDLTDYQKISAIYNYICNTVTYDYENLEDDTYGLKWSAYAAAVNKTAVCQGYATLFYRLALEAGIDNRVITGDSIDANGETVSHAWNAVQLDGKYYLLDSTWDSEMYDFQWFLKSSADFVDHDPDPKYETDDFLAAYPPAEESYEHPNVENAVDGDYEYQVVGGKAVLLQYNGTEQDVVVPSTLGGYPVYWIASLAFYDNYNIVSLSFSEGIRMMEPEAIWGCYSLKSIHLPSTIDFTASKDPDFQCRVVCGASACPSVETITVAEGNPNLVVVDNVLYSKDMTILRYYPSADPREYFEIPEGVISIGASAFSGNKNLNEVKMPDTVRRLQISCFENCSRLETINISSSCSFIDQSVFGRTALESIHIPASVETLFAGSFGFDCVLNTITVDPANPVYYAIDNVLYGYYTDDWENVTGDWLVKYPAGSDATSFTVPEGVVGIETQAFSDCANLQELILPDSLQSLGTYALSDCRSLTKIDLPGNLKYINNTAFYYCTGLVELVIPDSVEYLGFYLGYLPNLENWVFLGDAPEMSDQTFAGETIKIYYPAGNTTWDAVIQMYAHESGVQWIESCETHQFVSHTRDATCTVTGYTGHQCSVCGLLEVTDELIPATGHDLELIRVEPPSCEWGGCTYYHCNTCQESVSEPTGDPTGHNYVDGVCINCVANETPDPTVEPEVQDPTNPPDVEDPTNPTDAPDTLDVQVVMNIVLLAVIALVAMLCLLLTLKK